MLFWTKWHLPWSSTERWGRPASPSAGRSSTPAPAYFNPVFSLLLGLLVQWPHCTWMAASPKPIWQLSRPPGSLIIVIVRRSKSLLYEGLSPISERVHISPCKLRVLIHVVQQGGVVPLPLVEGKNPVGVDLKRRNQHIRKGIGVVFKVSPAGRSSTKIPHQGGQGVHHPVQRRQASG